MISLLKICYLVYERSSRAQNLRIESIKKCNYASKKFGRAMEKSAKAQKKRRDSTSYESENSGDAYIVSQQSAKHG